MPERTDIIRRLRACLEPLPLRFAVLYGSYAAGRPTPVSDLDVAVYADTLAAYREAVRTVDEAFPGLRTDVVHLKKQPALIYYEVLATGHLLFVDEESFFQRERLRVMREYLDFQPTHQRLLDDMRQRLREGTYGSSTLPA